VIRAVAADVLLGLAAAVVVISSIGILVMRDTYQKLHYVTPAALVAPVLTGLAVLLRSGWTVGTGQTWLTLLLVAVAGPYLAHATIRATWARDHDGSRALPAGDGTDGTGQDAS
jgi:multisubunit Na+/H+ antiporter MnhG subunit